jgi:hypothetical protein
MQFSGTNGASGRDSGRPSKTKQPYIPPTATVLTPDQAEEEVKAKATPLSQEFASCSKQKLESARNMAEIQLHEAGASSAVQT